MNISLPLLLLLILTAGCQSDDLWETEARELIELQTTLQKEQTRLISSVDSLWDATSITLEKGMPSDIPPVDRDIFLKSRNADHIRMFMSFRKLDPELQQIVHMTGEYDKMYADKIRVLSQKQQDFEKRKMMFLQKVAQHNTRTYQHYAAKFRTQNNSTAI